MSEITVRDDAGKFLEGASGNPGGRPQGSRSKLVKIKEKLELAVRENISAARIGRIVDKMATLAEEGDIRAARLIFDKFISNASAGEDPEEASSQARGITIRIENATFAKTQQPTEPKPIDVNFTEINTNGKS